MTIENYTKAIPIGSYWCHYRETNFFPRLTVWEVVGHRGIICVRAYLRLVYSVFLSGCIEPVGRWDGEPVGGMVPVGETIEYPIDAMIREYKEDWRQIDKDDLPLIVLGQI